MAVDKSKTEKTRLHPRNRNRKRYDLKALIKIKPELSDHLVSSTYGEDSIDFSNAVAVKFLNGALLHHYYGVHSWAFSDENLCPPIPGRADYIHHLADLLGENDFGSIPKGDNIKVLDIGVGASCIYPIIGAVEYGWSFVGSDIDPASIESSEQIVKSNPILLGKIDCRLQTNEKYIYHGVITEEEQFDLSMCNPPFHASADEALAGTKRKRKSLSGKSVKTPMRNFSGLSKELIYPGGEYAFINQMIQESRRYAKRCLWFSTLVSKQSNLKRIYKAIEAASVQRSRTIQMGTGNKSSRIVAWTFLSAEEQKQWRDTRWKPQV